MTGAGLLDTSVVIDWHDPVVRAALPEQVAISAVTAAELAAGPLLADTPIEAAKRQTRLQEVEARFEPIAFDAAAARSYGLVASAVLGRGRHPRARFAALLVAATAHAHPLELYTGNDAHFDGLGELLRAVGV